MSNIPFLLDSYLSIPKHHALAAKAKTELQYTVFDNNKPASIRLLYDETEEYVVVPRHYTDASTIPFNVEKEYWEYPTIQDRCFIEPCSDTQVDALDFLSSYGCFPGQSDSIVSLPCGEGKSYIGIKAAFDYGLWTLVIADTKDILNGWRKKLIGETGLGENRIGYIGDGKHDLQPVTLALVQTLFRMPNSKFEALDNMFGNIIYDEAHIFAAPIISAVGNRFRGRRLALTATLAREDGLSFIYRLSFGNKLFYRGTTRKKAKIYVHKVVSNSLPTQANYAASVTSLKSDEGYLKVLENDIRAAYKDGRKQLILSSRNDITAELADRLQDLHVGVNLGKTSSDVRDANLSTKPIIFTEVSIGNKGLDEKTIDTIRVITPLHNKTTLVQIAGRSEREYEGKKDPEMHMYFVINDGRMASTAEKAKRHLVNAGYFIREQIR